MKLWERLVGAFAIFSMLIFNMWYTNHVDRNSQKRQCQDYAAELALYRETPPDTPARVGRYELYQRLYDEKCVSR